MISNKETVWRKNPSQTLIKFPYRINGWHVSQKMIHFYLRVFTKVLDYFEWLHILIVGFPYATNKLKITVIYLVIKIITEGKIWLFWRVYTSPNLDESNKICIHLLNKISEASTLISRNGTSLVNCTIFKKISKDNGIEKGLLLNIWEMNINLQQILFQQSHKHFSVNMIE